MKSPMILSMLVCLPIMALSANSDKNASSFSSNYRIKEDKSSWHYNVIANLAEAISTLKTDDKQDILTLYLGSLNGDESERLAYKWAILEAARDKVRAFQRTYENKSNESFDKLERNEQIKAKNIINKPYNSFDTDLVLSQELSPKLETWLLLQGRINATKSSLDLIDDIESELKALDKNQKEQAKKISLLLKDYPLAALLLTGSILSLPEKYQKKIHTFLKNGSDKNDIEYIFKDD